MNYLFSCCYKDSSDPVIHNIENTLKRPLTNTSIVSIVDQLEEVVLEEVLEPVVNNVAQKIIGHDISGVIDSFIKKEVEPAIEGVMNTGVIIGLTAAEKIAAPIICPVLKVIETNAVPILNKIETIVPSFRTEIEEVELVLTDASNLLASNEK